MMKREKKTTAEVCRRNAIAHLTLKFSHAWSARMITFTVNVVAPTYFP
jgi:hypothetical protein